MLLLTLMVLIVLAVVTVQFQADSRLHGRSSGYRVEKLQCQYGAESGTVISSVMIKEFLRRKIAERISLEAKRAAAAKETDDPERTGKDSNDTIEIEERELPFLLEKQTLEMGEVIVEIEIHDENAKWPAVWLLASPFDPVGQRSRVEKSLHQLGGALKSKSGTSQRSDKLVQTIGKPLDIPESEVSVRPTVTGEKVVRRARQGRRYYRRRLGHGQQVAQTEQRRRAMGVFAERWYEELRGDPENELLLAPSEGMSGSFSDYLGVWGHTKINLNTAPVEVLVSALSPAGLTRPMAEGIVKYRQEKPFTSASQLQEIRGIPHSVASQLYHAVTIKSDSFSVQASARLGRTQYSLRSGMYINTQGQVLTQGVIAGDQQIGQ